MNKDSKIDYLACIFLRLCGPIIRSLPKALALFLGRRLGDLFYTFDLKHKAIAYANIKNALGDKLSWHQLSNLTRDFYQAFGQNLIEIFMIPLVDRQYLDKYISFEGLDYIRKGFRRGKGVILLAVHEGSWELSNIICANLGFPFILFVQEQRYPRLNKLLNTYRIQRGCKIIQRQNQTRLLIQTLKDNQAIGMMLDQGGKAGVRVKFFGKEASMSTAAIRLALKYDTTIIPVFYTRLKGPHIKVIIEPAYEVKRTGNLEEDIRTNLQDIARIFEKYIIKYPKEYLWTYKIWKYGKEKNILILSDGKTGHLRQSQAVANIISEYLKEAGVKSQVNTLEIKFKHELLKSALTLSSCLAGKYHCQGCLWCLKTFLKEDVYRPLIRFKPDVIISCGSGLAAINFVVSRENLAKSIVIMRPSVLSTRRFDLVIMPKHDNPPKRKNVAITEGALNQAIGHRIEATGFCIGLLIGGDSKNFCLSKDIISEVIKQIKYFAEENNADILATTSRRTSTQVERLIKEEFTNYSRCKLLIIANEKNPADAMAQILGLSQIVVVSPESISMISEAAASNRYVLVFNSGGLDRKHQKFLEYFANKKYIYLAQPQDITQTIAEIWRSKPQINSLNDDFIVKQAIAKIL